MLYRAKITTRGVQGTSLGQGPITMEVGCKLSPWSLSLGLSWPHGRHITVGSGPWHGSPHRCSPPCSSGRSTPRDWIQTDSAQCTQCTVNNWIQTDLGPIRKVLTNIIKQSTQQSVPYTLDVIISILFIYYLYLVSINQGVSKPQILCFTPFFIWFYNNCC